MPFLIRVSTAFCLFLSAWALVLGGASYANAARQASFDCAKARAPVELLICGDDEMAALDRQMGELYKSYRSTLSEDGRKNLLQRQRAWGKERLTECDIPAKGNLSPEKRAKARDCLANLYVVHNNGFIRALGGPQTAESEPNKDEAREITAMFEGNTSTVSYSGRASGKYPATTTFKYEDGVVTGALEVKLKNGRMGSAHLVYVSFSNGQFKFMTNTDGMTGSVYISSDVRFSFSEDFRTFGAELRDDKDSAYNWTWTGKIEEPQQPIAEATGSDAPPTGKQSNTVESQEITNLRQKAEKGDADAQARLGLKYALGKEVPKDRAEAAKWYRMAAEQGNAKGQLRLGNAYESGKGVQKDSVEALKLYRMAAEQGYNPAQYYMGEAYRRGNLGLQQDLSIALMWYEKAAAGGDTDSSKRAAEIRAQLESQAQIEREAGRNAEEANSATAKHEENKMKIKNIATCSGYYIGVSTVLSGAEEQGMQSSGKMYIATALQLSIFLGDILSVDEISGYTLDGRNKAVQSLQQEDIGAIKSSLNECAEHQSIVESTIKAIAGGSQ